ncbi:MAG: NADH-quinone oxidoreductase subunit J [Phycisphaerae bacterium]|nr:NADH-quinone oxidoreductase subunit J [Phycisphaerae bacterium]
MTTFLNSVLFYMVPVIGGAAVYLAMPGRRRAVRVAPALLGALAVGAMVGILGGVFGHASVMFYALAVLAVIGSARVVTHRKPVYSAVYFLLVVLSVAGIAILTGAEFLAAALLIVYAGAILVTYVFVIMLAQQPTPQEYDVQAREPLFAVLAGFVLIASLAFNMATTHSVIVDNGGSPVQVLTATTRPTETMEAAGWTASNTLILGKELMTTYVVAFEAAGVLLLVGIIGGIALATRRVVAPSDETSGGAA